MNVAAFLVPGLFLLGFDVYKAGHASFTHDESYTYIHYVNMAFFDILSYKLPFPNNHILNTLLVKLFAFLFGTSELSLRFPNILSHLAYLFFTYKLFSRYCPALFIPFFILVNFNPFLLDFFSLARGYGIAIGLLSGAVYYYIRFLETNVVKYHLISILCICFASLANFALLNVYIVFIILHNVFAYLPRRSQPHETFWMINRINIIVTVIYGMILYEPIRSIIAFKVLDFGGTEGVWQDTVLSLIYSTAYDASYGELLITFLKYFVIAMSLLSVSTLGFFIWKRGVAEQPEKMILFTGLLLYITLGNTILQHYLLNTPYLALRFALFLFPLFMIHSCLVMYYWRGKGKALVAVPACLFAGVFFMHTVYMLNTVSYHEWKEDRYIKTMLGMLEENKAQANQTPVQLGISWIYEPAINFYRETLHLNWLKEVDRKRLKPDDDFYYIKGADAALVPDSAMTVIYMFNEPKSILARHNKAAKL